MKQIIATKKIRHFMITFYALKRDFFFLEKIEYAWKNIVYKDSYKVHHGSYDKMYSLIYTSEEKLKKELKIFKEKNTVFYTSLKDALSHNYGFRSRTGFLIVKEIGSDSIYQVNTERKKKKNLASHNKRGKRYYCDCFHCTGTTHEIIAKKKMSDEKKINKG